MTFDQLQLAPVLLRALETVGYTQPTPIQEQAIPHLLEGRDLMGCAQTGTGKTAAFLLPLLQHLTQAEPQSRKTPRALILAPTRELAQQIADSFKEYGEHTRLHYAVIYGGVNQRTQVSKLRVGVDVLIATPGRLLDLVNQRHINLGEINHLVLDEADRMLDMGFIHDIRRIIKQLPESRQTVLFSATLAAEVRELASTLLQDPVEVTVEPAQKTTELIEQTIYFVDREDKKDLLKLLLDQHGIERALVFTRTKHGADKVERFLKQAEIPAQAIHGDKTQVARQKALDRFKAHKLRVLVATDVAARGIDVDDLTHVFNYDLPESAETYVHRIGRTGRAGASGQAIGFCSAEERPYLMGITRLIGLEIPVITDHPYALPLHPVTLAPPPGKSRDGQKPYGERKPYDRKKSFGGNGGNNNRRPKNESTPRENRNGSGKSRTPYASKSFGGARRKSA